jgi:hypothetical protein
MARYTYDQEGNLIDEDTLEPVVDPVTPGSADGEPPTYWVPPDASFDPSNPSGAINIKNPTADPSLPFVQAGTTGGYVDGHITRGQGESDTEESAKRDYDAAIAAGVPPEWAAEFLKKNYHDENRLISGYFSDAGVEDTRLGSGSSGGGGGGQGGSGYTGPFAPPPTSSGWMPTYTAPVFTPPAALDLPSWKEPAAFSYADFQRPTLEQARSEPGFAFAMEQGGKALANSAASKGLLRTGGTAKELIGFGQKLGEQNYNNVFNREQGVYDTNRSNASDIWTKNYGASKDAYKYGVDEIQGEYDSAYTTSKDAWDAATHGAEAEYLPKRQEAELNFKAAMDQWLEKMRLAGLIEADSD